MRPLAGACLSTSLALAACKGDERPAKARAQSSSVQAAGGESPTDSTAAEEFSKAAHTEALRELDGLVEAYLRRVEPVRFADAMSSPLGAPYAPQGDEVDLREQIERIDKKINQIRKNALAAPDQRRLESYLALAKRDAWRQSAAGPQASDALYVLDRVEAFVAALRYRLLSQSECKDCGTALTGLPQSLARAQSALSTASPTNRRAGVARARQLAVSLDALGPLFPAASDDRGAFDAALAALHTFEAQLAQSELKPTTRESGPRPWSIPTAAGRAEHLIERPEPWGADRVRDVFMREEAYEHQAGSLRQLAASKLDRFSKMREQLAKQSPASSTAGTKATVDAARCGAAWAPIVEFSTTQAKLSPKLDCKQVERWLEGRLLDDNELADLLIVEGLVPATMLDSERNRGGLLAAIGGRWNRRVGAEFRTVMFAFPLGRQPTGEAALRRLEHRVCLATVALEFHTQISDDELDDWLGEKCPQQPPQSWRDEAAADPRGAFEGMPAILMGVSPAEMVPVVEYSWAMYGLADDLARPLGDPETPADKGLPEVNIKIEEIDPATF